MFLSWSSFPPRLIKTHANPLFKPRVCSMSVSLLGTSTCMHTVWTLPASLSLHPHPLDFSLNGKTGAGNPTVYLSSGSIVGGGKEDSKFLMNIYLVFILVLQGAVDFVTNVKNNNVHILQGGSSITSTVKSRSLSACCFLRIFRLLCCGSNNYLFLCCYHCACLPFVLLDYKLLWEQRGRTAVCWILTKLSTVSPVTFSAQKIFDK